MLSRLLSQTHASFRCIKCKRYALGRELLKEEIYCLCDTGLIATDYLLYYYYGGLVCAALKEHAQALKLFEMAITVPTAVPDAIIVAAWHRYQIITALSTGVCYHDRMEPSRVTIGWCRTFKMMMMLADVQANLPPFQSTHLLRARTAEQALAGKQRLLVCWCEHIWATNSKRWRSS